MRLFHSSWRTTILITQIIILTTPFVSTFPTNFTSGKTTTLQQRDFSDIVINGLTAKAIVPITILFPPEVAAAKLELFYETLAYKAQYEWMPHLQRPLVHAAMRWAGLEINFVANKSPIPQGIPWEFIIEFAQHMAGVTRGGYYGCYDQGFWNAAGTFGVYVGLRYVAPMVPV
ncbi:hypothetical protein ACLMJK_004269 [Lecanora helva]